MALMPFFYTYVSSTLFSGLFKYLAVHNNTVFIPCHTRWLGGYNYVLFSTHTLTFALSLINVHARGRFKSGRKGREPPPSLPTPIFCSQLFFAIILKNYKLEQTEAELIINNAPLICVYPNTIKTCLTPSYLLFGRQLLLSFNTTSTVAANLICRVNQWTSLYTTGPLS